MQKFNIPRSRFNYDVHDRTAPDASLPTTIRTLPFSLLLPFFNAPSLSVN
jgi:hypothetical protein